MSKLDVLDLHGNQVKFPGNKWAIKSDIIPNFKQTLIKSVLHLRLKLTDSLSKFAHNNIGARLGVINLYTVLFMEKQSSAASKQRTEEESNIRSTKYADELVV